METGNRKRDTLWNWVMAQIISSNFAVGRAEKKASDNMSGKNGNLSLTIQVDVELLINSNIKDREPGYISVPKGSELMLVRTEKQAGPDDVIATVFVANKYQASLRGDGRTSVRTY